MTMNIRYGTFETNSSSVHTIVFHKTDMTNVIDDRYMDIHGGEYGRYPQECLSNIEDRLNYLWTGIWDININYEKDDNGWHQTVNREELQWWKDAIHLYCPNAVLYDIDENDWYGVDHADCLINLFAAMKKDISILKDFLLDPFGEINITGDEYEDYDYDRYYNTEQEQLTEFELDTFVYIKGN